MTDYFAYIRVSTARQGEHGVSLQEQRSAIERYADTHGLTVSSWFEERVTAAKSGRPVFSQMLKLLRQHKAQGIVIHKIDRSARNLRDWANLGELIDVGVDVRFANESLDLNTRGGRLSADIQAVVAADYIRNLREETRKGFYGRLKQGLYPIGAPLGYLNNGGGKAKTICPEKGHLVRRAFELYSSGTYSLDQIGEELHRMGLRNRRGNRISRNGWSKMFNNPFYVGLVHIRSTGETYEGRHPALVPRKLFEQVQDVLAGKTNVRQRRHVFTFSRLLDCSNCTRSLTAERQKGRVYYRCHSKKCRGVSIREVSLEEKLADILCRMQLRPEEAEAFLREAESLSSERVTAKHHHIQNLDVKLKTIKQRQIRLTEAYLEGSIERELFEEHKRAILLERREVEEQLSVSDGKPDHSDRSLRTLFELLGSARKAFKYGDPAEMREFVRLIVSNCIVVGKSIEFKLNKAFALLVQRPDVTSGGPQRDAIRTYVTKLSQALVEDPLPEHMMTQTHDAVKTSRFGR